MKKVIEEYYCDVCPECTEKISLYIDTDLKKEKEIKMVFKKE